MALRDVAEFVPQDRGQLVAVADHGNQPQVHAQVAARQGKGVDRAVAPQHDLPGKTLGQFGRQVTTRARCRQQGLPDALHVLGQHRVVQVVRIAVDFTRDAVPQAALVAAAHGAGVAQRRDLGARGLGACRVQVGHAKSY